MEARSSREARQRKGKEKLYKMLHVMYESKSREGKRGCNNNNNKQKIKVSVSEAILTFFSLMLLVKERRKTFMSKKTLSCPLVNLSNQLYITASVGRLNARFNLK